METLSSGCGSDVEEVDERRERMTVVVGWKGCLAVVASCLNLR